MSIRQISVFHGLRHRPDHHRRRPKVRPGPPGGAVHRPVLRRAGLRRAGRARRPPQPAQRIQRRPGEHRVHVRLPGGRARPGLHDLPGHGHEAGGSDAGGARAEEPFPRRDRAGLIFRLFWKEKSTKRTLRRGTAFARKAIPLLAFLFFAAFSLCLKRKSGKIITSPNSP